jgi:radical SAM protein with 4Fe4S-binding SPASM domain
MVTNLSLLTAEQYEFFRQTRVSLCTSLDGPEDIHNANRPWPGHNSYQATTGWIRKMREQQRRDDEANVFNPHLGALVTITRAALPRLREVIDEYRALGFTDIHLRKLSYLGLSGGAARKVIGYSADEFMDAWKDAMDYIIELNRRGVVFGERGTLIFLRKILTRQDPDFLDVRSPCGAAAGQLAYSYNGDVYTCDEARMQENDTFLLGNVRRDDYQAIISNPKVKAMLVASTLENLACDECVYKPYCGTCPVVNLVHYGTLLPSVRQTELCRINSAMLDYIFEKLLDRDAASVFERWLNRT